MLPLQDITVLDLSRLLPGPYCSMLLADLGCSVTKIEEPQTGDYTRWMPPFIKEESARFLSINRNKKSMTLNLKTEKGREIFFELVEKSDIVLESFRPGTLQRLQIDYQRARKVNPRIIYCSITAYGQTGPYSKKAAHDINILGVGGVLSITSNNTLPGVQIADTTSGLLACIAILTALIAREKTGKGQYIDISMLDGVISLLSMHAAEFFATGKSPVLETMPLSGAFACYTVYETGDNKFITLGALEPKFWKKLCKIIKREDLIYQQFAEDQESLKEILQEIFKQNPLKYWLDTLTDVCTPVNSIEEALSDPQVVHRKMLCDIEHPAAGTISQIRTPLTFSDIPGKIRIPPPLFGEHTKEILTILGYSLEEIEQFKKQGII